MTAAATNDLASVLALVGPEADHIRKIASAIRDGRPGSSVRLTRLVDDVSTWTAVVPGLPPHEFDDRDDASEWASDVAALVQAKAVSKALAASPIPVGVPFHVMEASRRLKLPDQAELNIVAFPYPERSTRVCGWEFSRQDEASMSLSAMVTLARYAQEQIQSATHMASRVAPDAYAYHDDVTAEGVAAVRARVGELRPARDWKVVDDGSEKIASARRAGSNASPAGEPAHDA